MEVNIIAFEAITAKRGRNERQNDVPVPLRMPFRIHQHLNSVNAPSLARPSGPLAR